MVSPMYAARRSAMAKAQGFGRKGWPPKAAQTPVAKPRAEPAGLQAAPAKPRIAGRLGLLGGVSPQPNGLADRYVTEL